MGDPEEEAVASWKSGVRSPDGSFLWVYDIHIHGGVVVKRSHSVICPVAALLVSLSLGVAWNGTAGASIWPKVLTGRLLVHPRKSLPFGSIVTNSHILGGTVLERSYSGKYGYGQADIGIYEYPVSTNDHGLQWRIAGPYFNLDDTSGEGAGNSPTNIVVLSRSIVVAYRRGDIMGPVSAIFVTVDSGRQWFIAFAPGTVKKIVTVLGGKKHSTLESVVASVSSYQTPGGTRTYKSLNGGRSWSRS